MEAPGLPSPGPAGIKDARGQALARAQRKSRLRRILGEIRREWTAYAVLAPGLLLFVVFTVYPIIYAFYLSFHDWNVLEPAKPFVGFDNYRQLWNDDTFRQASINTAYFTVLSVPGTMAAGLLVALILNQGLRMQGLFRTMYFLPVITSLVAASIIWKWVYQGDYGLANYYLTKAHILDKGIAWLSDPSWAMPAVIVMSVWKAAGFAMVVYLAGLQAIPANLYEAADVDGAGRWHKFRHITLPLLSPTTFFLFVISIIGSFQVFAQIFVMTSGGPLNSTTTIVYDIYRTGFHFFQMGYAAAMAYALFGMLFVFTVIQMRVFYKEADY
jgi:multiple sugar transport system permease protein